MKLIIGETRCTAIGKFGPLLTKFLLKVSGRKGWDGPNYRFENSGYNIRMFKEVYPDCVVEDQRPPSRAEGMASILTLPPRHEFQFGTKQYEHQVKGFDKIKDLVNSALFMGTGTGKTKTAIDKAIRHYCLNQIDALLIITLKGVHDQWVLEQLPDHVHPDIPWSAHIWRGMHTAHEKRNWNKLHRARGLHVFSINVDAVSNAKGLKHILEFIADHSGRVYCVVDESQCIKNQESKRHENMMVIRPKVSHRSILSGTPIAVDLLDEWSQFMFLDPDIIGHEYKGTFRSEYCNMGGFENSKVVSHKNLEHFNSLVDPYIFRVTKEEDLDLPPKVYTKEFFQLTDKQRKLYDEFKQDMLVKLEDGSIATTEHAAVLMMRLQQISSGFIIDQYGEKHMLDNPRLERALWLDEEIGRKEKKIFWCRFQEDIDLLMKEFGSRAVQYDGRTSDADRLRAKAAFLDPNSGVVNFISNPAAGGTGLNLQGHCGHAIYYTNSYNAIHRWQSEDRIHRIGTYKTIKYIDLVASRSVDNNILRNLKSKKDFSTLVLDDIRKMMEEDDYAIHD